MWGEVHADNWGLSQILKYHKKKQLYLFKYMKPELDVPKSTEWQKN